MGVPARGVATSRQQLSEVDLLLVRSLELTQEQTDLLFLVASGLSNRRIAPLLNISPDTVKSRVSSMLQRLRAVNRAHMVAQAYRLGLLEQYPLNSKELIEQEFYR